MSERLSAWAEVELAAIAHNARLLASALRPPAQLMAVVKANAYGHGALRVAQTALQHGAVWLGIARVSEGRELRAAGIRAPMLLLGPMAPAEAADAVRAELTIGIASLAVARALSQQAVQQGRDVALHLKIDSGMSRYGVPLAQVVETARALNALPRLQLTGAYTHFATADEADPQFTQQQAANFTHALRALAEADVPITLRHAANSAGALAAADYHFDLARAGIALYGVFPRADAALCAQLRPALSLKSRVALVRELPAGASIGYGRAYTCERAMRVALVSIGYADGVRRALSNRGAVLIRGQRARILGRVSMYQLVVDAEACGAEEDDAVVLIGQQGAARITVEEVADWAETIAYEIFTGIGARVPRIYV